MRPWFPMYAGDLLRDTQHLTSEEFGMYVRLMLHYYSTGRPIPDDLKKIRKICGETLQKTRKKREVLLDFFESGTYENEPVLFHYRIETELDKAMDLNEKLSKAGRAGGLAKARKEKLAQAVARPQPQPQPLKEGDCSSKIDSSGDNSQKRIIVPFQEIVDAYHEILPTLPRIAHDKNGKHKLGKTRMGYIRQRWIQDMPSMKQWRNFFEHIAESVFLMGEAPGRDGHPPFQADLEWITKPNNFLKIAEGKYHRVRRKAHST